MDWIVLRLRTPRTEQNRTERNGTWNNWKKNEQERNDLAGVPRSRTERNDFKKVETIPSRKCMLEQRVNLNILMKKTI